VNFNGVSAFSDSLSVHACDFPSQPPAPVRIDGTTTTLFLGWSFPADDGGCPLTGFHLYRDDGNDGLISIEIDPLAINDIPTLNNHQVTFSSSDTGKQFRFRLSVDNAEGTSISRVAAFIIAQVPDKPISVPTFDIAESDANNMLIYIEPFSDAMSGGSAVLGYEIQMDDGQTGQFHTVMGSTLQRPDLMSLETQIWVSNLMKGVVYRV
jgi:hypothetical protein